jgi:hypothetical protein
MLRALLALICENIFYVAIIIARDQIDGHLTKLLRFCEINIAFFFFTHSHNCCLPLMAEDDDDDDDGTGDGECDQ